MCNVSEACVAVVSPVAQGGWGIGCCAPLTDEWREGEDWKSPKLTYSNSCIEMNTRRDEGGGCLRSKSKSKGSVFRQPWWGLCAVLYCGDALDWELGLA